LSPIKKLLIFDQLGVVVVVVVVVVFCETSQEKSNCEGGNTESGVCVSLLPTPHNFWCRSMFRVFHYQSRWYRKRKHFHSADWHSSKLSRKIMIETQCKITESVSSVSQIKELAIQMIKYGISSVNPRTLISQFVQLKKDTIVFGKHKNGVLENPSTAKIISLPSDLENEILVLGMGKATGEMLFGLIDTLISPSQTTRLRLSGMINVPYGQKLPPVVRSERVEIQIHEAGHPVPDENTVTGTLKQLSLIQEKINTWSESHSSSDQSHVVVVLVSGGGSALFEVPVPGTFFSFFLSLFLSLSFSFFLSLSLSLSLQAYIHIHFFTCIHLLLSLSG
jgi:hypothetical protein